VRTFTPQKTKTYEQHLATAARRAIYGSPLTGPLRVHVTAVFPIPPSWPKKTRARAEAGGVWHIAKPDLDNIYKIVGDGCNGVLWADDATICSLSGVKFYGLEPALWIEVEQIEI